MLLCTSGTLEKFKRETPNSALESRKETVAESRQGRVGYTQVGDDDDVVVSMNASPVSAPLHASNVLARLPQSAQGIKALRMQRMMSPSRFNANTKTPVPSSKPGSQRNLGDSSATSGQTSLRGKFELSARCEYIGSTAKESTIITSREALVKGALAKVTKEQAKMKNRGFKTNSKAARAARLDFYSECVLGKLQSGVGGILFELRKTSTFSCLVSKSSKKKYRGIVVISATDRSGAGVWHVLRCRKGHVPLKDVLNKLLDISFISGVSGSCENLAHVAITAATAAVAKLPQSQTTRLGFYPTPNATSPFARHVHLGTTAHLLALPSLEDTASESTCDPSEIEYSVPRPCLDDSPTPSDLALFKAGTAMKAKVIRQNSAQLLKLALRSGTPDSVISSSCSDFLDHVPDIAIREIGEDSEGVELEAVALVLALADGIALPGDEPMFHANQSALNAPSVSTTSSTASDSSSAEGSAMCLVFESACGQANELSGLANTSVSDDCVDVVNCLSAAMQLTTTEHTDVASTDQGTDHDGQASVSMLNAPTISSASTDSSNGSWASYESALTFMTVGGSSAAASADSTTDEIAGLEMPLAVLSLDQSMLNDITDIEAWKPSGLNAAALDDDQGSSASREGRVGQGGARIATDIAAAAAAAAATRGFKETIQASNNDILADQDDDVPPPPPRPSRKVGLADTSEALTNPGHVAGPSMRATMLSTPNVQLPAVPRGWFTDLDRATAVAAVSGKPDGTFVVRPSAKTSSGYVLTYSALGSATHSSLQKASAGFSIVNGGEVFATLDELVHAVMQRPVAPLPWSMVPVGSVQQTQGPSMRHVPPPPVQPPQPMTQGPNAEDVVAEQDCVDVPSEPSVNPFPGRFDFEFKGRSIYTASEIIVDATDWNLGTLDPLFDQLPKVAKIKRAYVPPAFKNTALRRPSHIATSLTAMTKMRPRKSVEL